MHRQAGWLWRPKRSYQSNCNCAVFLVAAAPCARTRALLAHGACKLQRFAMIHHRQDTLVLCVHPECCSGVHLMGSVRSMFNGFSVHLPQAKSLPAPHLHQAFPSAPVEATLHPASDHRRLPILCPEEEQHVGPTQQSLSEPHRRTLSLHWMLPLQTRLRDGWRKGKISPDFSRFGVRFQAPGKFCFRRA